MTFLSFAGAQTEAWFLGPRGSESPVTRLAEDGTRNSFSSPCAGPWTEQPGICTPAGGSITKAVFAVILVYLYIHFFYFKGVQGRAGGRLQINNGCSSTSCRTSSLLSIHHEAHACIAPHAHAHHTHTHTHTHTHAHTHTHTHTRKFSY